MITEKVKIFRKDKTIDLPKYHTEGSVGFDLFCKEDAIINPKEIKLVPLNNVIETPKGYALCLFVRSSTPKKKGLLLANSVGVIDQDYCGEEDELGALLYNFTEIPVEIKKGDRLIQGMFIKIMQAEFEEIDSLEKKSRKGFGSTGH